MYRNRTSRAFIIFSFLPIILLFILLVCCNVIFEATTSPEVTTTNIDATKTASFINTTQKEEESLEQTISLMIYPAEIEWEPNVPIVFTVFIKPDSAELPENAIFECDFGDHNIEEKVFEPGQKGEVFNHVYNQLNGLFYVTVSLVDSDTNEKLASVESKVIIDASLY